MNTEKHTQKNAQENSEESTQNKTRKFTQKQRDHYDKVAAALGYIDAHLTEQPDLATLAKVVGVSPYHFQKIFSEWAGVSPKKYLQFLSLNYAKTLLPQPPKAYVI